MYSLLVNNPNSKFNFYIVADKTFKYFDAFNFIKRYDNCNSINPYKIESEKYNDLKMKKEKGEEVFLQVYSLGNKSKFADYKYSSLQNTPATVYYDWSDILKNTQKKEGK